MAAPDVVCALLMPEKALKELLSSSLLIICVDSYICLLYQAQLGSLLLLNMCAVFEVSARVAYAVLFR